MEDKGEVASPAAEASTGAIDLLSKRGQWPSRLAFYFVATGDVGVFGGFHPRFRGVGVSSVACGFMLVCYYSMLIAWVINAFFDSFKEGGDKGPWAKEGTTGQIAIDYFYDEIVGQTESVANGGKPTEVVHANVGYSFMSWLIIWLCIAFGVKWTGR
eukprot:scaffold561_cov162-Amphora_coffeaeformis.AAC.14